MGGYDVLEKVTVAANANEASVHVRPSFAFSDLKHWLRPIVVAMTPDDAMALSIELQKASIDARYCEYHRTAIHA